MRDDPLAPPPRDSPLAAAFLARFGLDRREPDAAFLERIARAFAVVPYENLTKIIKYGREGDPGRALRPPPEVFGDHVAWGSGGTCFSLTALLLHLVRACGYRAEPVLADRPYGQNTHCALLVELAGATHLLDPGYLILKPVPVATHGIARVPTPFNEIILKPEGRGDRLALATAAQGKEVHRLTFKLPGADPGEFMRSWHESFSWDMMRYPLLTCCRDGTQRYLQDRRYQERSRSAVERRELEADLLPAAIAERFGIAPAVIVEALELVKRKEGR
jgi:arylamine N-acetyltransferase